MSLQSHFVQQKFRKSIHFSIYLEKTASVADPITSLKCRLKKKTLELHIVKNIILSIFIWVWLFKFVLHFEISTSNFWTSKQSIKEFLKHWVVKKKKKKKKKVEEKIMFFCFPGDTNTEKNEETEDPNNDANKGYTRLIA